MSNDYSVAFRLFSRYNLSVGVTDAKGTFERVLLLDQNTPDVIIQRTENVGRRINYYVVANTNLRPVNWWQIVLNLSGSRNEVTIFDNKRTIQTLQGYIANMFTMPNNFMFDLIGIYRSPSIEGNAKITTNPMVNASLRKDFFNRRLSMRIYVDNILDNGIIRLETDEKDFYRNMRVRFGYRQFGLSLRYNFQAGKSVQVRNVETGAAEEKARLQ